VWDAWSTGVVDSVVPTHEAAVEAGVALIGDLPDKAVHAYHRNKQYLQRPYLQSMVGETYDQFIAACYTPEAQVRFTSHTHQHTHNTRARARSTPHHTKLEQSCPTHATYCFCRSPQAQFKAAVARLKSKKTSNPSDAASRPRSKFWTPPQASRPLLRP